MSKKQVGLTNISGKEIPFSFDYEKELITLYFGENKGEPVDIPEGISTIIGKRFGMLSGGNSLFKLSVPIFPDHTIIGKEPQYVATCDQNLEVDYVVEGYIHGSRYTELRLRFPELDWFLPSRESAKKEDSTIEFSLPCQKVFSFDVKFRDTDISVSLCYGAEAQANVNVTARTISEVSLQFPETDNLEYICDIYLATRSFFVFVCNRQNIGLRNATLLGTYSKKTIIDGTTVDKHCPTSQKIYYNQKYIEPEEDREKIKKVPSAGLFASRIKELFQLFFEETESGKAVAVVGSIHSSFKYRNLIDLKQSLHITAAFEYYVRELLPEISSQETIDFCEDIKNLLENYIKTVSGKKKKKAKAFQKSLSPQLSLEEKVLKVFGGYKTWPPLISILSDRFGADVSDLANTVNLWRNELAHEKRDFEPSKDVIDGIRLVEHLNYCILLRQAGYNDEEISAIISTVLIK